MDSEIFDVVVIGLSGIAAARFYLDVHPESRVLIVERDSSIGGPWGKSRMYPGFWSQSGIRMSGFSDVPLTVPKDAEVFNDIFEAKYITEYLENYVDNHIYAEKPLRKRILLSFAVSNISKVDDLWVIKGGQLPGGAGKSFRSRRIIVATGTTSDPKMPTFTGSDQFNGLILHQKDYGLFAGQKPSEHRRVAVLGAGKSAADIVYGLIKSGNEVHWIIRKTGEGPGAFTNPADNSKGPFLNDPELAATRLFATMSPGCFTQPSAWTRFLHDTSIGNALVQAFWNSADQKCKKIGDFHHRPGALKGFDQLESSVKLFWATGPFGMIQRPDFWDTVARNVHVHRNDIEKLEDHIVVLKDGPSVPIDVIVCATGFQNGFPFFDAEERARLGLPHPRPADETAKEWEKLEKEADQEVLRKYPKLAKAPVIQSPDDPKTKTPNRLYNCITPVEDHTIAFVGNIYVPNGFRAAEVQAIWTTALFDGMVQLPSKAAIQKDVAWVNAFINRRYPTHGSLGNYFQYDMMGYIDRLLSQVGLSSHRKGWWADLTYPLIAKDLSGTTKEYVAKYKERREKDGETY
ncbi:FAD/NAD(P)-binding domain-containing protein [Amniculicola lignicola CBS 123094]|uniref:FAD/NAD(P)-binding domain-containing protein n=1 Tax=Amniculicola lignicola CBS 123094 TaxID=1392246 RepID=A0A6A5W3T2_9PLEO|nr:FAD/NAD(P)-binding domain-containing protein [Amniculicola lignicola CBS 123094]